MIVIRNRKMVIPYEDVYIGTSYDTNTEIRMFKVQRYTSNHKDLAALNFRLDLRYNITDQNAADTVMLSKEIHDDYILLKWEITESVLQAPGTAFINLRATENGTNRWSTFIAAVYIGHTLYTPGSYTGSLTEIEQMEADYDHFKQVIEDLEPLVNLTDTAEAWAVGQRNGHDVASSDVTYHNNAKYYADNSHFYASNSLAHSIDSQDYSRDAEAWASGQRNGTDVGLADPAYLNNAKYYSDNAATSANQSVTMAETAEAWAEGEINDVPVDSSHPAYHNNAKYYAGQANYHSDAALTFSGQANDFALDAEGWAVGQNGGVDVASTDPAYHNNAKYHSEQAAGSATAAETFKNLAQGSATSAVSNALSSEAWAVGKRGNVDVGSSDQTYHNNAKYYAEQADASVNLASVHKDAAQTAATNAAASATNAAGSALDASDYAGQAAASASAAAASAASLTVDSALSDSSTNPVQNKVVTAEFADVKSAIDALKITDTASGAIASFPDGAAMPMESLTVELEPIQEGTGDPSPDNIRPITGRYSVTVTRTGKNLFDKSAAIFGILNASGDIISTTQVVKKVSDFIPVVPGGKYYVQNVVPGSDGRPGFWYDASKTGLSMATLANNSATSGIFAAPSDAAYIRISAYAASVDITMLEVGELKSDYEPYDGQSATIQLGQTVYGGTVDVTTGTMTVKWKSVDMGTLNWGLGSIFYAQIADADVTNSADAICSVYSSGTDNYHFYFVNHYIIRVKNPDYSSAAEFKAAMTGQQIVYKLAKFIEIQLDAHTLNSIYGQNNVWSDADSVTVEYVADPKLYIARLTEPDADMVADANITSGHYFMVGNSLYLATSNIASGAAITPGVNCTRTNLASALNAINA